MDSSSVHRSWEMSHLPVLQANEIGTLLNMLRSWFEQSEWDAANMCNIPLIWDYAERHGISGLIGSLNVSGKVANKELVRLGQQRYFSNALYYEQSMSICHSLQKCAGSLEIPMSFIKGPTLISHAYRDPGCRSYSDIDIIVESRENAWKLINAMDAECPDEGFEEDIYNRFNHPGRIHAHAGGWELEFCYPVTWQCDPMFELFEKHKDSFMRVPTEERELSVPDPDIHMIILIQHLARHMCSRLIWFLDIAAFARAKYDQIDFARVERELGELQLLNISSEISHFCNKYIDNKFPIIEHGMKGWNDKIQKQIVSPELIHGRLSLNQKNGFRKYLSYILSPVRFYLISDPKWQSLRRVSSANRWLISRLFHTFQVSSEVLYSWFVAFLQLVTFPLFYLLTIYYERCENIGEVRNSSSKLLL